MRTSFDMPLAMLGTTLISKEYKLMFVLLLIFKLIQSSDKIWLMTKVLTLIEYLLSGLLFKTHIVTIVSSDIIAYSLLKVTLSFEKLGIRCSKGDANKFGALPPQKK